MKKESPDQAGGRLPASLNVNTQVPLFSFDLNFDSLKVFLDKTTITINQHAELINALQSELQVKQHVKVLPEVLGTIGDGGKIMDNTLAGVIKNQMAKSAKTESSGDPLSSNANKVFNRLTSLGYAVAYTFTQQQEYPSKMEALQKDLNKRAMADQVKEKHKKLKSRVLTDLEEMRKQLEKKITDLDAKYAAKVTTFEDKVQAVEKKTLWKIQDCEEMLKKRITEEYVDDSCRLLEERIKRDLLHTTQVDADHIERISTELMAKMKVVEESVTEKNRQSKKLIKDLEEIVNTQCVKSVTLEEFRKVTNTAIDGLQRRQKELESSLQVGQILDRQNIRIKSIEDKINDLSANLSNRIQDLSILVNTMSGRGSSSGDSTGGLTGVDLHKLCAIEGDVSRAQDTLRNHASEIDQIKNTVMAKLENIDVSVFEAMNRGNSSGGGNARIGELEDALEALSSRVDELASANQGSSATDIELKRLALEMKEFSKRFESIRDLEKRVQRIFKEFDFNSITRMLKGKAEQDEVMRDFAIVDTKINSNADQIAFCRKDIDNLILLYKKLVGSMSANSSSGDLGSILSTKKLHPYGQLNCLSCGVPKNNLNSIHSIQPTSHQKGSDGKSYRIDVSMHNETMSTIEQQQQRSIFQNHSMTSIPQVTTKLSRPHTAQIRTDQSATQQVGLQQQQQPQMTRVNTQGMIGQNPKRQLRPESAKK